MTFSLHENMNLVSAENPFEISPAPTKNHRLQKPENFHLFNEKITVPHFENYLKRARLDEVLQKSLTQFGATLITGRAGTGKTALAANFARNYQRIAWFSVESTENDWSIFFRYFCESLRQITGKRLVAGKITPTDLENISPSVENLLSGISLSAEKNSTLIVIDGIHNVFDAEWFGEFFTTLLYSLPPQFHLLMLSRSNPPLPLWRLRSKQVLGVIDEKLLAFNSEETEELFKKTGIPLKNAKSAQTKTLGRISRLKDFINNRSK